MKKIIIAGVLAAMLVPTVAFAGTKTKTFNYDNSHVAKGTLTTKWSMSNNDEGYAKTELTKGNKSVGTYIESQDTAGGSRTDWDTVSGSKNTKTISRKSVWRFNSSHYMKDGGSTIASTTQTDW
ncbi:hypothetical protein [Clostridium chrysemydis]|uniref:hypothetical protein n=1 Tax=Clostridium chrysemydis TaxID=2665504 RepID=UPI003F3CB729